MIVKHKPLLSAAIGFGRRFSDTALLVATTTAFWLAVAPWIPERAPYLLFTLAVMPAARIGGRGPGLAATLLSGLAVWYFGSAQRLSLTIPTRATALSLVIYLLSGVTVSFVLGTLPKRRVDGAAPRRNLNALILRQTAVFVGATLAVVILVALIWRYYNRTEQTEASIKHTRQLIHAQDTGMSILMSALVEQRTYLLTGDENYLRSYKANLGDLRRALEEMTRTHSDIPGEQAELEPLGALIEQTVGDMQHTVAIRKSRGTEDMPLNISTVTTNILLDRVRREVETRQTHEYRRLDQLMLTIKDQEARIRWMLGLGCSATLIVLILASVVIEHDTRRHEEDTRLLARQASMLEQAKAPIIMRKEDGTILYWNRGAEDLYGFSREEALGHRIQVLLGTRSRAGILDKETLLPPGGSWRGELTHIAKDGRTIVVESHLRVAADSLANKTILESHYDVTHRNQAEAIRSHLAAIVESSEDYIIAKNLKGIITHWNAAAARLYGYTSEEAVGQSFRILIPPERHIQLKDAIERIRTADHVVRLETEGLKKDGTRMQISITLSPIKTADGNIIGISAIGHDITERKRAEAENAQLAIAVEQAWESIVVTDSKGNVEYANPAFTRVSGYGLHEVLGQNLRIQKSGVHDENFYHQLWTAISSGKVWHGEFVNRRKNGSIYTEDTTIAPVRSPSGDITHFIAIKQDVTERKRAEAELHASEARLRLSLDAANAGTWEWETATGKHVWSKEMWTLLGLPPYGCEPTHRLFLSALHPGDRAHSEREMAAAAKEGRDLEFVFRPGCAEGSDRWLICRGQRHYGPGGHVKGLIGIVMDITQRKKAEEVISKNNADLEQRVRERTVQLRASNAELEAFSYSVSHDLQAPIRQVISWVSAFVRDYSGNLSKDAKICLKNICSGAEREDQMIKGLLKLFRLTRKEIVLSRVDLSALVHEVATRVTEGRPAPLPELVIHDGIIAKCDAQLMDVALTNLLENAIKFSSLSPKPRIEFGKTEQRGREVFFIRDNGVGFDMAYADRLFGPYQRLHKETEFAGTGIGLATVRRVIARHGGEVWANAEVGKGATFYLALG